MHSFGTDTAAPEKRARNIALELREFTQLFNPIDPSPFENKDLNPGVEEFIVGSAEEYPPNEKLTLRIYLDHWPADDSTEASAVLPSIEIVLLSHRTISRPSRMWPASEIASCEMPSIRQPSPAMT